MTPLDIIACDRMNRRRGGVVLPADIKAAASHIRALSAAGFVIVPREPTTAMHIAGNHSAPSFEWPETDIGNVWTAMIVAWEKANG